VSIFTTLRNLLRSQSTRYVVDDPRSVAESAPYTFFLPSENELLAIEPGDIAKVTFRGVPPSDEWDAERMWVVVTGAHGDRLVGKLDNHPSDLPQLTLGDTVEFKRSDVIDILWSKERVHTPPPPPPRREFWDRCMVDDCVLRGRSEVDYLYREAPDMALPDDKYPDSGWRIRGNEQSIDQDEANGLAPHYVALGNVLNQDDTWLDLIDYPAGSAFRRQSDGRFHDVGGR
jgi:hypothetical protein